MGYLWWVVAPAETPSGEKTREHFNKVKRAAFPVFDTETSMIDAPSKI